MSIPAKLISGVATQAACATVAVLSVPFLLSLMGSEGYGLVAVHLSLQAWMMLLEMGLPTALARKLSVWRAGREDRYPGSLVRSVEAVLWALGVLTTASIAFASPWIASKWLNASTIEAADVTRSLQLMACLLSLRWLTTFYQAALHALHRQNFVNATTVGSTLLRTCAAIAMLALVSNKPEIYFAIQLIVTCCELLVLRTALKSMVRWSLFSPGGWSSLAGTANLAGGFSVITFVWLLVTQADKLVLSHRMQLQEFGLFSMITAICTGIAMLVPAFTQALAPRLTALLAQQRRADFLQLYRTATALLLALSASLAGTAVAHPELLLRVWVGDPGKVHNLVAALAVYAAGTGLANMVLAPFLLQCAAGDIRAQVRGYVAVGLLWTPMAVWASWVHGPWGAGMVWFTGNALLLIACWVGAHRRLLSVDERKQLYHPLLRQCAALVLGVGAASVLPAAATNRPGAVAMLACIATVLLAIGILASAELRRYCVPWWSGRRPESRQSQY